MREHKTEVLIAGAGPVGLMSAALLADAGVKVDIIDRQERATTRSYACAVHPASLRLLDGLGLAAPILKQGRRIQTMAFYEGSARRAEIDLTKLSADFPFVLVLPQSALEEAIELWLRKKAGVPVQWNYRLDDLECEEKQIVARIEKLGGTGTGYIVPHWESVVIKRFPIQAQFLIGADGHGSLVRHRLAIEYERLAGLESFAVIEFTSDAEIEDEVRVVLDEATTNVLWPLPENKFRWSFQLTHAEPEEFPEKARISRRFTGGGLDEDLRRWVQSVSRRRAPWFKGSIKEISWCVQVGFEHRLAKQFGRDRCWLAGDAAHQTGPVGSQSMNVGLLEAEALARELQKVLQDDESMDSLAGYDQRRQQEWKQLLAPSGDFSVKNGADPWVRDRWARILPCIPASGAELRAAAKQLGAG
jgi:2-polyprenyl-6-methoxyphenol hydroxylase-like FAD-dependent oxidoreductase